MISTRADHVALDRGTPHRHGGSRAVVALARVDGRRLVTHPLLVTFGVLAVLQSAPFLLSRDATTEQNVGWLLYVGSLVISFGLLLAANLSALRSRRDGAEELFEAAPVPAAGRTLAKMSVVWAMGTLACSW